MIISGSKRVKADAHCASKNTSLKRNTLHCYIFASNWLVTIFKNAVLVL